MRERRRGSQVGDPSFSWPEVGANFIRLFRVLSKVSVYIPEFFPHYRMWGYVIHRLYICLSFLFKSFFTNERTCFCYCFCFGKTFTCEKMEWNQYIQRCSVHVHSFTFPSLIRPWLYISVKLIVCVFIYVRYSGIGVVWVVY